MAVIDNDQTLWGKYLQDIPVTGISNLSYFEFDLIVVTSVSGREFNAFSFRSYSDREWDDILSRKFYQNRVLPAEWKRIFEKTGLEIIHFAVDTNMDVDGRMLDSFSNEFRSFSEKELGEVNCKILARKNELPTM